MFFSRSFCTLTFLIIFSASNGEEENPSLKSTTFKVLRKLLPSSIKNLFSQYHQKNNHSIIAIEPNVAQGDFNKEHGTLDFIGRDIIRGISRRIGQIQQIIGWQSSNSTGGLDVDKSFFTGVTDAFKIRVQAIYPGTKWCGDGNKSRFYDDLGTFFHTDTCCREHDNCPNNIAAGQTKYGLINTGLFTRSHCDCDRQFYDCLKQNHSIISTKIGFTYFTVLGPQCFQEDYPVLKCARKESNKCVEYAMERSRAKIYQWFDNPKF